MLGIYANYLDVHFGLISLITGATMRSRQAFKSNTNILSSGQRVLHVSRHYRTVYVGLDIRHWGQGTGVTLEQIASNRLERTSPNCAGSDAR